MEKFHLNRVSLHSENTNKIIVAGFPYFNHLVGLINHHFGQYILSAFTKIIELRNGQWPSRKLILNGIWIFNIGLKPEGIDFNGSLLFIKTYKSKAG